MATGTATHICHSVLTGWLGSHRGYVEGVMNWSDNILQDLVPLEIGTRAATGIT